MSWDQDGGESDLQQTLSLIMCWSNISILNYTPASSHDQTLRIKKDKKGMAPHFPEKASPFPSRLMHSLPHH